jgi:hypothetical protein
VELSGEEEQGATSDFLLDRLLYKGVLPRYAFPTDVVTFHVFDAENSTDYQPAFRFTPSQGLSLALSQYAPGKEVWVGGKKYVSGAIYSPMRDDMAKAWENRRLYFECDYCHYARTEDRSKGQKGDVRDCPACGRPGTLGKATYWLRPPGFAHPSFLQERLPADETPERSYATRAKLAAPSPADPSKWIAVTPQLRLYHLKDHLLVTNRGPREDGYDYCTKCGLIEPNALNLRRVRTPHQKPFPAQRDPLCPADRVSYGIVLGTDFITDVLLVSVTVNDPYRLTPGNLATDVALRTVSEALAQAACELLELEAQELLAEYRPALTASGKAGTEAEVYLYDTLPGGAGFCRRARDLGMRLFERAMAILEKCPENCDSSCYRCLRSYKNKFEHDKLDRHLGGALLRHAIDGSSLSLPDSRARRSLETVAYDLQRFAGDGLVVARDQSVTVPGLSSVTAPIIVTTNTGKRLIIDLSRPLAKDTPITPELIEVRELSSSVDVHCLDEILVRRNLPRATEEVLQLLGISA